MRIAEHKKILLDFIGYKERAIAQDVYQLDDGNVAYIKVSKIHKGGNYWFTINELNISNFEKYKVDQFIFSGPKGYYRLPILELEKFISSYVEIPKDGKYHFGIYPDTQTMERSKDNVLSIRKFFFDLPDSLRGIIQKEEGSFPDRNYFTYETGKNSFEQLSPDGKKEFEAFTIQHHKDETKVGDIVFFSQAGDRARISWEQGLSAICMVSKTTKKGTRYLKVKLKPILPLPKVLNKIDFKGYFDLYDVKGIGPMTHGQKSQPNTLITTEVAQQITATLIQQIPKIESSIIKHFGKHFPVLPNNVKPNKYRLNQYLSGVNKNEVIDQPFNLILHGAPGTGKSFELKSRIDGGTKKHSKGLFPNEELRKRITFHPNYSYRNFVGSYKPKPVYREGDTDKKYYDSSKKESNQSLEPLIEYVFEAGPLLEMYVKAHHNPDHNFVIIIEELNRSNPAAVFGDMFQLLDRKDGVSEYPITLEPAAHDYLISNGIDSGQISLPSNLYLWATMNNADQGVMPMDSAFKRRWCFEYMALDENQKEVDSADISFPWGTTIKWNKFRDKINTELIGLNINEDKLIGPFFLKEEELENPKAILNKLLLYLKDDVLKYNSGIFKKELKTFSKIVESYNADRNVFEEKLGLDKVESIEA